MIILKSNITTKKIYLNYLFIPIGLFFYFLCFTHYSYAASFNCEKAATSSEKLICDNPSLSKLDEFLSSSYNEVKKRLSESNKKQFTTAQVIWLKDRNEACGSGILQLCEDIYKDRIFKLELENLKFVGEPETKSQKYSYIFEKLLFGAKEYKTKITENKRRELLNVTVLHKRGIRGFILNMGLNLKTIEKLAGVKVFLNDVHDDGIKYDANEAGKYNPEFLYWVSDLLEENIYKNKFLGYLAEQLYHTNPGIKEGARVYYLSYVYKNNYSKSEFLEGDEALINDFTKLGNLSDYAIYDVMTSYPFWQRRKKDGTDEIFLFLLSKFLRKFDPHFYMQNAYDESSNVFVKKSEITKIAESETSIFDQIPDCSNDSGKLCKTSYEDRKTKFRVFEVCDRSLNKDVEIKPSPREGLIIKSEDSITHYKFDDEVRDIICRQQFVTKAETDEVVEIDYILNFNIRGKLTDIIFGVIINLGGTDYSLEIKDDILIFKEKSEIDLT